MRTHGDISVSTMDNSDASSDSEHSFQEVHTSVFGGVYNATRAQFDTVTLSEVQVVSKDGKELDAESDSVSCDRLTHRVTAAAAGFEGCAQLLCTPLRFKSAALPRIVVISGSEGAFEVTVGGREFEVNDQSSVVVLREVATHMQFAGVHALAVVTGIKHVPLVGVCTGDIAKRLVSFMTKRASWDGDQVSFYSALYDENCVPVGGGFSGALHPIYETIGAVNGSVSVKQFRAVLQCAADHGGVEKYAGFADALKYDGHKPAFTGGDKLAGLIEQVTSLKLNPATRHELLLATNTLSTLRAYYSAVDVDQLRNMSITGDSLLRASYALTVGKSVSPEVLNTNLSLYCSADKIHVAFSKSPYKAGVSIPTQDLRDSRNVSVTAFRAIAFVVYAIRKSLDDVALYFASVFDEVAAEFARDMQTS